MSPSDPQRGERFSLDSEYAIAALRADPVPGVSIPITQRAKLSLKSSLLPQINEREPNDTT
jgi:hypothetical protein